MEGFKTTIMSLDKSKFHLICLKTDQKLEDGMVAETCEELGNYIKEFGVDAVILPFVEGHQIDIKAMDKQEFQMLVDALIKQKEATPTV